MKKFLNEYKINIINLFLIIGIIILFLFKKDGDKKIYIYFKFIICFAVIFFTINWIFLKILLKRLSFLYSFEKIREILSPIQDFLINEIFTLDKLKYLKNKQNILIKSDILNIENKIDNILNNLILKFLNKIKIQTQFKEIVLFSIREMEIILSNELKKFLDSQSKIEVEKIKCLILSVMEQHFENFMIFKIQNLIYITIKNCFEWFVVYAVLYGIFCAIIIKFLNIF